LYWLFSIIVLISAIPSSSLTSSIRLPSVNLYRTTALRKRIYPVFILRICSFVNVRHSISYNNNFWEELSLSLMLRPTVSRPVCLGIKLTTRSLLLRVCWFLAPSLTRGRVCCLQFLLALASAVIFWSESQWTRDHILLSQIRDFPFRRLLRLAGSRWGYSTPPPHGAGKN
jgi:hypothetical protein